MRNQKSLFKFLGGWCGGPYLVPSKPPQSFTSRNMIKTRTFFLPFNVVLNPWEEVRVDKISRKRLVNSWTTLHGSSGYFCFSRCSFASPCKTLCTVSEIMYASYINVKIKKAKHWPPPLPRRDFFGWLHSRRRWADQLKSREDVLSC